MGRISAKHVTGFFLAGAAVGAAAALLYAPKSGAQTRKDIRKFSKKTVDRIDELQDDVREQLNERYTQALEVFDNVMEYVEEGKSRLQKLIRIA